MERATTRWGKYTSAPLLLCVVIIRCLGDFRNYFFGFGNFLVCIRDVYRDREVLTVRQFDDAHVVYRRNTTVFCLVTGSSPVGYNGSLRQLSSDPLRAGLGVYHHAPQRRPAFLRHHV